MKRIEVKEIGTVGCVEAIESRLKEKRISFIISEENGWVQVNACGPCEERLKKEKKPIQGCEKCVKMTMEIIDELGYTGSLKME